MTLVASLNPLFQAAAENTSLGWLMGLTTILFLSAFIGWVWWVYRPDHKAALEAAGMIPLLEDDMPEFNKGGEL